MTKKIPTSQYEDEIRELISKGCSTDEISEKIGKSYANIHVFCSKKGIKLNRKSSAKIKKDEVLRLVDECLTAKEIAQQLGVSVKSIYNFSKKHNIKMNVSRYRMKRVSDYSWWEPLDIKIDKETLFSDYMQWWAFEYKYSEVTEVTFITYRLACVRLKEYMADVRLCDLNRSVYQKFLDDFAKTHHKQTVRDLHNTLNRAIKDALYEKLIDKDPTYRVSINGTEKSNRAKKYLSEKELSTLLAHLDYNQDMSTIPAVSSWIIYLLAKTGVRFAEAQGVTPDDFNFETNELTINKTWDHKKRGGGFMPTKTKSSIRTIIVDVTTMTLFKTLTKDKPRDKPLFYNAYGRTTYVSNVNGYLKNKCKELGIPVITSHSLRHTHASILLGNGVEMITISKRLGHSDLTTTQSVYSHITDELRQKDNVKLNETMSAIGGR